jgi:tetratricopeptide (TPR) repeat protein
MTYLKNYLVIVLLLLGSVSKGFAQSPSDEALRKLSLPEKYDIATELMRVKQYYQSLRLWLLLVEEKPDNYNYNFKTGVCYLNQNLNKTKALPYLEKCLDHVTKNYNPFDFTETKAPVDLYYYLGKAYHLNYQFDKAIEMFTRFKNEASSKHILQPDCDRQIAMANNAKFETANPRQTNTTTVNLGPNINSEYSDYSPVISLDENALYFTSRRLRADSSNIMAIMPDDGKYYEDIYVSFRDPETGEWKKATQVDLFNKTKENEATISVSADGMRLYIYHDVQGDGNIFFSDYVDTAYSEMEPIGDHINSTSWETHITFTPDGSTCYFVSDRPGGLGGRDIYRCTRLPNGEWSQPLNVGAPLNTIYDEDGPFISADGRTLYFSSNSDKSMGGFDIFFCELKDDMTFTEPTPIGVPINSVDDDVFFITSADGKRGYFTSVRNDSYGEKDIYMISMDTTVLVNVAILKGYIQVPSNQKIPDDILIVVSDLTEGGDPTEYRPRPQDGSYVFVLTPCHEYLVDYQQDGTSFHQYQFQVPCEASYQQLEKVLMLDPIAMGVIETPDTTNKNKVVPHWKILGLTAEYLANHKIDVDILDAKNKKVYTESVNPDGTFNYRKLDSDKSYIFKLREGAEPLCDELEIVLLDENGNEAGKTVRDDKCKFTFNKKPNTTTVDNPPLAVGPTSYEKHYHYNRTGVDKDFNRFINDLVNIIKANGVVYIDIESSASKVPTTTYGDNDNLAKARLKEAKQKILAALAAKGISADKVKFVSETSLVQGPEYNDDWNTNREVYEKYQYIRIKAK